MEKLFRILFSCLLLVYSTGQAVELSIQKKSILVNGKEASVYTLEQPDGTWGVRAKKGEDFNVLLKNSINIPTSIHWHGLILPNSQDGVAFITQYPIYPGLSYAYRFPLKQSGTFWMHSHYGFQEQNLLSAPLIIYDPEDASLSDQEVILLLADFSFQSPEVIYQNLRCKKNKGSMDHQQMMSSSDLFDVNYDAFLINYRTAENPEVVKVESGKRVRLRVINGSSATNFFISLGDLKGKVIAVDGNRIKPFEGSLFELATAQRIDIVVEIPRNGNFFPILAQGEGTDKQAGAILASSESAQPPKLQGKVDKKTGAFTNLMEKKLQALYPLKRRPVEKRVEIILGGNMSEYVWTLNGQSWPEVTPIVVENGQRVEMIFKNVTSMSHPMHLHGHVFQVTEIDGVALDGAMRDTILVPPNSTIAVQFDADNPGVWPLHCHILYHLEGGMFTVLRYKDYIQPL